ncbi:MAG: hypothetical protein KF788_08905 [Piscinibacter sp.]|nr:hypothetical protein [Piscinibacter sp.]
MPTAVTYVLAYAASSFGLAVGSSALIVAGWIVTAAAVFGIGAAQRRKAARRARDAFNAGLQDRLVMTQTADGRRSRLYGRVRNVDGVVFKQTHGVNSEFYTLVISVAGHEVDAIERVYFGDTPVELDADGWVLTAPWNGSQPASAQATMTVASGSGSVVLPVAPIAGTVSMAITVGSGDNEGSYTATPSVAGTTVSVTGAPIDGDWTVNYQFSQSLPKARVRTYLGGPQQDLYAVLSAIVGTSQLQPSDRFANDATLIVTLEYNQDVYPTGIPNPISALVRGAKVLNLRTGAVEWSENPAEIAYDWALYANGGAAKASEVVLPSFVAAANACDVATSFTRTDGSVEVRPLYQCGIAIPLEGGPDAWMDEIVEAMAGKWDWDGGQLIVRAGVYRAPVATIDESWITDRQAIQIVPQTATAELVNVVRPTISDAAQHWVPAPTAEVRLEPAIAADGQELPLELELRGVTHAVHAMHVAGVLMRETREGLTVTLPCNLKAFPYRLFDCFALDLPLFGWNGDKQAELVGKSFSPDLGSLVTLRETSAGIYDPEANFDQLTVSPNTGLPEPTDVPQVTGVAVASGTTEQLDRSILVRTIVSWDAVPSQAVRQSGKVEVQWIEATATLPTSGDDWPGRAEAEGNATQMPVVGLRAGIHYLFRARARTTLGVRGAWSDQKLSLIADAPGLFEDLILTSASYGYSTVT